MNEKFLFFGGTLLDILLVIFYVLDFIQNVYYSKRFYSHLKSREKEIRLFYFDKEAYFNIKWIRKHFLVCNILVTKRVILFVLVTTIVMITDTVDIIPMIFDRQGYFVVLAPQSSEADVIYSPYLLCIKFYST